MATENILNGKNKKHAAADESLYMPPGTLKRVPASMAAKHPRVEPMLVTPEVAKRWLEQNTLSNRPISEATVNAYLEEIEAGRWALTHQSIAFNPQGELVDGQHRLTALLRSGRSVVMMVATGFPIQYNSPIDTGYVRRLSHLTGKTNRWVSVVRALCMIERGLPTKSFKFTLGQVEDVARNHKSSIDEVLAACRTQRACPTGLVAALTFAHPVNRDLVIAFAREVDTGEMLQVGDPAYALRRWVLAGRHTPRETILAAMTSVRAALTDRKLTKIHAGVTGSDRDGYSNYQWLVQRRRGMRIYQGTPTVEEVSRNPAVATAGEETPS